MAHRYFIYLLIAAGILSGCRSAKPVSEQDLTSRTSYEETTSVVPPDPQIEAIIAPYREQLESNVQEVIGQATGPLERSSSLGESTLGNMAADAMLYVINKSVDDPVDIALTNNGGLRVPIAAGAITVEKMFELMPFENTLVILEFNGTQIDTLAQQIARFSGAIAGLTFTLDSTTRTASDIRVNNMPIESSSRYRVVTSDYLANGGGRISVLRSPLAREDLTTLLRDAFIEYVRDTETINPILDGRIRVLAN